MLSSVNGSTCPTHARSLRNAGGVGRHSPGFGSRRPTTTMARNGRHSFVLQAWLLRRRPLLPPPPSWHRHRGCPRARRHRGHQAGPGPTLATAGTSSFSKLTSTWCAAVATAASCDADGDAVGKVRQVGLISADDRIDGVVEDGTLHHREVQLRDGWRLTGAGSRRPQRGLSARPKRGDSRRAPRRNAPAVLLQVRLRALLPPARRRAASTNVPRLSLV